MGEFKVGDIVDVIDRRDGATVDRNVVIEGLVDEPSEPHVRGGWTASLSCGYRVSVRCLRRAGFSVTP